MTQGRLSGLALISINRELAQQISYEAVTDDFASKKKKKQKSASVGGYGQGIGIGIISAGLEDFTDKFFVCVSINMTFFLCAKV